MNSAIDESDRPCPRCNQDTDSFTPEKIAKWLSEVHIDPSRAADETVYKKRLDVCAKCGALMKQVMCSHCGCIVMFRARPVKSRCPHPEGDKWADIDSVNSN